MYVSPNCPFKTIDSKWNRFPCTPPVWRDLVKISTRKLWHYSPISLEYTNLKNVIFENTPPVAPSEVAKVKEQSMFKVRLSDEISTFQEKRWGMSQLSCRNFY